MAGLRTICITVAQIEGSDEAGAHVTAHLACDEHGAHEIKDEFRIGVYETYYTDADWMRDMLVALAERY